MKIILVYVAIMLLIASGCKTLLNNSLNEQKLICGFEERHFSADTRLFQIRGQSSNLENQDIQIFSEDKVGKISKQVFFLTKRSCIEIPNFEEKYSDTKFSIVFKNRLAGTIEIPPNRNSIGLVELLECGDYCGEFPKCGLLLTAGNKELRSGMVFQVNVQDGKKINATLEKDEVQTALDMNERNCFVLANERSGKLRLQDESGNFLEKEYADIVRDKGPELVGTLTLRKPLTPDEKLCRANSQAYKLQGEKCVPKSFKDLCHDGNGNAGVALISTFYLRPDCERIEASLRGMPILEFRGKSLTNIEIFSGLDSLRELDVSQASIFSLSPLIGVPSLESIVLNSNRYPFDLASLQGFPQLKKISLMNTKLKGTESMPVLSNVEDLSVTELNPDLLKKLPNLKKLMLVSIPKLDLISLPSLQYLETIVIENVGNIVNLSELKQFPRLKNLEFTNDGLVEDEIFPVLENLMVLRFKNSKFPMLQNLSKSVRLEELSLDLEPIREIQSFPQIDSLKKLTILSLTSQEINWLKVFPNLEEVLLEGEFPTLANLPHLKHVKSFEVRSAILKDLKGLENLDGLEYLAISKTEAELDLGDLPVLSNLLGFDFGTAYDLNWTKKTPNLRRLQLTLEPSNKISAKEFPENLEALGLNSGTLTNFEFLKDLTNLNELWMYLADREGNFPLESMASIELPNIKIVRLWLDWDQYLKLPVFSKALLGGLGFPSKSADFFVPSEEVAKVYSKLPLVKDLTFSESHGSLVLLQGFREIETLTLDAPVINFLKMPKLFNLKQLKTRDFTLEDFSGIENLENLERIEFAASPKMVSLAKLKNLKNLKEIVNARHFRDQFVNEGDCPETIDSPIGLRNYCYDLQMSFMPSFGPSPF